VFLRGVPPLPIPLTPIFKLYSLGQDLIRRSYAGAVRLSNMGAPNQGPGR